jgi:hypothetical protein
VITGPQESHDCIAVFLKNTRNDTAHAEGGLAEAQDRVAQTWVPGTRPFGTAGAFNRHVLREFPPGTDSQTIRAAADELTASGKQVQIETYSDGTTWIVDPSQSQGRPEDAGLTLAAPPSIPITGEDRLARLQAKVREKIGQFEVADDNPVKTVTYKTDKIRKEYDEHWHYLMKGLEDRPAGQKSFVLNINRKSGGKEVVIEAPVKAHEQLFEPMFSGVDLLAGEERKFSLQPSDEVKIQVAGGFPESPINGLFVIEPEGTVALGAAYGRVKISGLSLVEAEQAVADQLKTMLKDFQVQITLPPGQQKSQRADDGGEVLSVPGAVSSNHDKPWGVQRSAPFVDSARGLESRRYVRVTLTSPFEERVTPQEIERRAMNLLTIATHPQVLKRALARTELQDLPGVKQPEEFAKVLASQLQVSYPGGGEIMEFILTAPDSERILEQITLAFEAEVAMTKPGLNVQQMTPGVSPYIAQPRGSVTQTTYLYDGKSFEQWRDLWKLELKTERRIEAIHALAAFARAGRGEEAAEAIFDVAGEYDPLAVLSDSEGQLVQAVINVVALLPGSQWMPLVLKRLGAEDPLEKQRWQTYAAAFLERVSSRTENRELAVKFAEHANDELLVSLARYLLRSDQNMADPHTVEIVRKGLRIESPDMALLHQLGFRHLDKAPEQIDLLLDEAIGKDAREYLNSRVTSSEHAAPLIDPLLAILDDPARKAEHIAAVRALRALAPALRRREMQEHAARVTERLVALVKSENAELLVPAWTALLYLKGNQDFENLANQLQNEAAVTPERAEALKKIDPQLLSDETNVR